MSKRFFWFEQAANEGNAPSMEWVGFCYEQGQGVEKNLEQAKAWYEKAVVAGSADAQARLDKMK